MAVRDTSIDAYKEMKESGKSSQQEGIILKVLIDTFHEARSRRDLAGCTGMEITSVCGRVNSLVKKGLIEEPFKAVCSKTGKKVWVLKAIIDAQIRMF